MVGSPPGARRKAMITAYACAPGGAPRSVPPARLAAGHPRPARCHPRDWLPSIPRRRVPLLCFAVIVPVGSGRRALPAHSVTEVGSQRFLAVTSVCVIREPQLTRSGACQLRPPIEQAISHRGSEKSLSGDPTSRRATRPQPTGAITAKDPLKVYSSHSPADKHAPVLRRHSHRGPAA
jgi:hypothetical protein